GGLRGGGRGGGAPPTTGGAAPPPCPGQNGPGTRRSPVTSTGRSPSSDSLGCARPPGAARPATAPAGSVTLSSVSRSGPPAARRYRAPGGSHNAVSRRTAAAGPSPDVSRPAPSITYHSSPPGPATASNREPAGT